MKTEKSIKTQKFDIEDIYQQFEDLYCDGCNSDCTASYEEKLKCKKFRSFIKRFNIKI